MPLDEVKKQQVTRILTEAYKTLATYGGQIDEAEKNPAKYQGEMPRLGLLGQKIQKLTSQKTGNPLGLMGKYAAEGKGELISRREGNEALVGYKVSPDGPSFVYDPDTGNLTVNTGKEEVTIKTKTRIIDI